MKLGLKGLIVPDYMLILTFLNKEPMTLKDIKIKLGVTHSNDTKHQLVESMLAKGWITKIDRLYQISGEGRKISIAIEFLLQEMGLDENKMKEYRILGRHKKEHVFKKKPRIEDVSEPRDDSAQSGETPTDSDVRSEEN